MEPSIDCYIISVKSRIYSSTLMSVYYILMNRYLPVILIFFLGCQVPKDKKTTKSDVIEQLKEAYIFAYPLVLMDITKRYSINNRKQGAPLNQFYHKKQFPDHTYKTVVKPNNDTYYSTAWLDLREQPIILSVPATERYYLLPIYDAWTNVIATPGTRTTGKEAQKFLIAHKDWNGSAPPDMKIIRSATYMVHIIGRTQVNSIEDGKKVVSKIQDGFQLTPLHGPTHYRNEDERKSLKSITNKAPKSQVKDLAIDSFFTLFNQLLEDNPSYKEDSILMKGLVKMNIGPNQLFSLKDFPLETLSSIRAIPSQVHKEFPRLFRSELVDGWRTLLGLGHYGIDYKKRAFIAHYGLGANLSEDTIYPTGLTDSENEPYHGKHKYLLHFPKGQLPPTSAFWSLTMYNNDAFLVKNPIDRYAIGDRDKLRLNVDGSLDIWIQHTSPDSTKLSNWLPAPEEEFMLTLRIYWPKESALNGTWHAPAVQKLDN